MQLAAIATVVLLAALNGRAEDAQRLMRRTSVRAALANKMDPHFWPTRGRRSNPDVARQPVVLLQRPSQDETERRQTSDEEGPFWANRGRSIPELEAILALGPILANKGHSGEDSSISSRQTDVQGPFWANRGRSAELEEGPFWANRGRATGLEEGPFWANRGRSADAEGNSAEEGPFWANRGRSIDENLSERLQRDLLYAEEPTWISLPRHGGRRSSTQPADHTGDTFWVARGKKQRRSKRELSLADEYWVLRNRRGNKINRALEQLKDAQFWPSRGKKSSSSDLPQQQQHINSEKSSTTSKSDLCPNSSTRGALSPRGF